MGRRGHVWERKGRGFYAEIGGKQVFLGHDRKEAERAFHLAKLDKTPQAPGQHSTHDLIVLYLQWFGSRVAKGECSKKTLKSYRDSLQAWENEYYSLAPEDMRAYHVTAWLAKHPGWNPTTCHDRVRHVRIWCDWLCTEGFLEVNRLQGAKSPTPLKREPTAPGNLEAMERAITDPYFLAFFTVLYDTGARPGEIATLEASRVHWGSSSAVVTGKTGERVVGLTERSLAILRDAAKERPEGPVLVTARGNPWLENSWSRHWQKWARIAGCVGACHSYHCRHDLHRRWHAAGVSDVVTARQLGHVSRGVPHIKLLVSTYGHPDGEVLAQAANQASSAKSRKRG